MVKVTPPKKFGKSLMKVFVYFNLHKKLWSVKALEGANKGRVIAHCTELALEDCTFKVSEVGRQRVLREKRKNVHAGVVGQLSLKKEWSKAAGVEVVYNPYKGPDFYEKKSQKPIAEASRVVFKNNEVLAFK